ncbi:hypothetical protein [Sporichthya brevicatena]|uniref:hypothetical protein n=1 Tax=Sporichthya brevicatena TaxID=171442 RepID=UPI0031D8DD37
MPRTAPRSDPRADAYAAANRPGRVNVTLWMGVGLLLPLLYGVALVVAVVVDAWRAGG